MGDYEFESVTELMEKLLGSQGIGGITGAALAGKGVADFLRLHIGQDAVVELHDDVHDQQADSFDKFRQL